MVRVSVVIPIFNSAKTIARTLESVLNQDFAYGTEIIAVDDGSTDATAHELSRYSSRLRIISQENKGVAAAENAGAVAASGEYIAFCDADDVWMPDKLGATVAALDCNREAVLAYSDCLPVGDDGVPIATSLVPSERAHAPSMQELLWSRWPIVPSAAVIRRDAYEACGGQCTELRSYHDVYLWMLLRELGPFEYVARPLVKYRKTTVAERTLRDERYYDTFVYQVRARYQNSAETLLRATRHGCANLLGYRGLLQMRSGNLRDARHSFARALRREPIHLRNALRLMRTFLPVRLALRLGGRTCRPERTPSSGTAREFPPGRGAVGDESRRIQPHGAQSDRMTTHWSRYHAAWNKLAPPLRPNAEVCAAIRRLLCERAGPVLLLGVTPELADIAPRVVAVDRSGAMIAGVWPGNTRERRAVNGNWLTLPFAQRTFAAVVGDGTLNAVDHPSGHRQVYDELARVLRPGGRTVFRTFAAPRRCESVAQVRDDLMAGAIGSFHGFKWRLAMALVARQKSPNICVRTIHDSFSNEFPGRDVIARITGWDAADIDTIDVYRHSTEIYSFPTIEQFQSIIPAGTFSNVGFADAGSYELADRCPLLFYGSALLSGRMARIVVITHEYDDFSSRNYLIEGLFGHWLELGHEVVVTAGTPSGTSGDIAILHVDCSVVEEAYLDYAKRFPVVLNASTRDIRKSAISRVLVTRGDDWCGPVVVKSDLNCGGLPERIHNRVAARMGHAAAHAGAKLFEQYEVLDSQALVRRRVWKDPNLVVERFIPECDERGFWLRTWVFFGDSERCNRYCGPRAIVKASETTFSEPVPVPEELREMRARLGFDYGKFDFVVNQGRATLLDANRTPGSAPNLSAHFVRNAGSLAAGINYFLKERAKVTA